MEYLLCIGIVIGLPTWFVMRSIAAAKQQRLLEEHAWRLQNWEYDDDGYEMCIHFPSMTAKERRYSYEYPGFDFRSEYEVRRRNKDGAWQIRHTPASYETELGRVREQSKGTFGSLVADRLQKLEAGNKWESLAESWQAPIETAYQRYIHRS